MTQGPHRQNLDDDLTPLRRAATAAEQYLSGLRERPVGIPLTQDGLEAMRSRLGPALTEDGRDSGAVVEDLISCIPQGVVASGGPRFFGYVVGGALPGARAVDWLVTAFDQFAATFDSAPAMSLAEETALRWVVDLLGLPAHVSGGFTTGSTMAHQTALLAARTHLLAQRGWDVEARGLAGAPELPIVVSAEAHVSLTTTLRYIGFGEQQLHRVPTDGHGRMLVDELRTLLTTLDGPALVCAAAGEINTGAFDRIDQIAELTRARGDWLHVDGAFGLWAAATPGLAHLAAGIELADSWAVDAHKMLQVPYDCGIVLCAHPEAHQRAMNTAAPYTVVGPSPLYATRTQPMSMVPEMARRARGVPVWAALQTLGRRGLAELVQRCHDLSVRMAALLQADPEIVVPHEVVFNQVLVDVAPPGLPPATVDRFVGEVIDHIRNDGTCWIGGTRWGGRSMLRVSVANHLTSAADIDASAAAIRRAVETVRAQYRPDFFVDLMPAAAAGSLAFVSQDS